MPSGRSQTATPDSGPPSRPWTTEYAATVAGPAYVSVIATTGCSGEGGGGAGAAGPGSVEYTP